MPKPQLISALDLGSDTIKIAVAQKGKTNLLEILALEEQPSGGIRRGVIVDAEKVAKKISKVLERAETVMNKKIKEVICNINGSHLFVSPSRGVVAVSRADQQISQEDIDRVISAAQAFSLPSNKEILQVFPREFIVDGEAQIKDPLGMRGIRLEAEILAICCFSPYLKNLTSALSLANLNVLDIIPSGLAASRAVLNVRQKELGVCCLDIGAWTTNMAVFGEEELVHSAVFPVGSGHITNDIAIGLQIDVELAERIKIEFGDVFYQKQGKPEKIKIFPKDFSKIKINNQESGDSLQGIQKNDVKKSGKIKEKNDGNVLIFSRKLLVKIIAARVTEIFNEVQKELKKIGKTKLLPAGIVLTGGGVKLPNIENLAKKEFKLPCQIGFPKGVGGLRRDTAFSNICGLLLEGVDSEKESNLARPGFFSKIKRIFKNFVP